MAGSHGRIHEVERILVDHDVVGVDIDARIVGLVRPNTLIERLPAAQ